MWCEALLYIYIDILYYIVQCFVMYSDMIGCVYVTLYTYVARLDTMVPYIFPYLFCLCDVQILADWHSICPVVGAAIEARKDFPDLSSGNMSLGAQVCVGAG